LALLEACGANPAAPTAAAGTLETTTIRIALTNTVSICQAPLFVAEELLKAEGFTGVEYVRSPSTDQFLTSLTSGASDMTMQFSGPSILYLDSGKPITILAGIHVGCFELFGSDRITEIGDLKG